MISDPISLSGGSVELDVPIGADRTIQVLGVISSTGECPSSLRELVSAMNPSLAEQVISSVTGAELLEAEVPVILASTTLTITAEESVTLRPSFAPSAAQPLFCDGKGAPDVLEASVSSVGVSPTDANALETVVHVGFNKAVDGFSAADVVPESEGVEIVSVVASGLREFDVLVRVTPNSIPTAQVASQSFLNVTLAAGGVSDLFGRVNRDRMADLSGDFIEAAGVLWNVSPAPSSPPSVGALAVTGLSNDPIPTNSKTWAWSCTAAPCIFRFLIDTNPAGVPTGTYGADVTATQPTGEGAYYLHVQALGSDGTETSVETVSALLDNTGPTVNSVLAYAAAAGPAMANTFWDRTFVATSGSDSISSSAGLQMAIDTSGTGSCGGMPSANITWTPYDSSRHSASLGVGFVPTSGGGVTSPIVAWIRDEAGNLGCGSTVLTRNPLVVSEYYVGYSRWNDYVTNGSAPMAPTGCMPTAARSTCIHAGRTRAISLAASDLANCAELQADGTTVSDGNGHFAWACVDGAGGPFLTGTLAAEKGLSDLVDFDSSSATNRWKANTVTITRAADGATAVTYSGQAWWSDGFSTAALSDAVPTTLGTSGEILTIASSQSTAGIQIAASKVSVVIKSGVVLTYTGGPTNGALISGSGAAGSPLNFIWVEGPGNGQDATNHLGPSLSQRYGLALSYVNFGVVRGLRSSGGGGGFRFAETNSLRVEDLGATQADGSFSSDHGYGVIFQGSSNTSVSGAHITATLNGRDGFYNASALSNFEFTALRAISNTGHGLTISGSSLGVQPSNGEFSDIVAAHNGGSGIAVLSSSLVAPIRIYDFRTFANSGDGVMLMAVDNNTRPLGVSLVNGFTAFNGFAAGDAGVDVQGTVNFPISSVRLVGITAVNNFGEGIKLSYATTPLVHNVLLMGNGSFGLSATSVTGSTLSQVASIRNAAASFNSDATVNGGHIAGTMLYDLGLISCSASTGLGIYQSSPTTTCTHADAYAILLPISTVPALPFVGVRTSDSANTSLTGSGTLNLGVTQDWVNFENGHRLFGVTGASSGQYTGGKSRACTTTAAGDCQLFDLSLSVSAPVILNAAHSGTSSSISCEGSSGSLANVLNSANYFAGANSWHANAVEKIGDRSGGGAMVGNDNGLCEAGEACIYTPNFGAYQGHGTLESCTPVVGANLTGVTMQKYPSNGRTP
jgi:hypothetical protein